jgi:hypothetical protein
MLVAAVPPPYYGVYIVGSPSGQERRQRDDLCYLCSLRLQLDRGTPPCCDVMLSVHFVTMTLMSELSAVTPTT